jgi:hypothetical protein
METTFCKTKSLSIASQTNYANLQLGYVIDGKYMIVEKIQKGTGGEVFLVETVVAPANPPHGAGYPNFENQSVSSPSENPEAKPSVTP